MLAQTRKIVDLRGERALLDYLQRRYHAFEDQSVANPASRLKDLRILHLRGPAIAAAPKGYAYGLEYTQCVDRPVYEQFPEVQALVAFVRGSLGFTQVGNVMLSVMPPDTAIEPHWDPGQYFEYFHRIHVPIITDPLCICASLKHPIGPGPQVERCNLEVGWAWELNNCDYHWFYHDGKTPRYHVVFDAR